MKTLLALTISLLFSAPAFATPAPEQPGRAWVGSHTQVVALMKARKNDEVVKAADALLAKNAKDYEAHYLRGRALFQLKRDAEAIKSLSKAIELKPDYPNPYFFRALTLAYSKKGKEAALDFGKATQLAPNEARYWLELARNYARVGDGAGAAKAMESAVKLAPKESQFWYLLGNYQARSGAEKKAMVSWGKAVALNPKHIDAQFNLGQSLQTAGKFAQSAKRFAAVLAAKPTELDALEKMVQLHYQQGKLAAAQPFRERFMKAQAASPRPEVKNMKDFCFDQFKLGKDDIYAYETLKKGGDLYYHYIFRLVRKGRVVKSVNLESSAYARERGIAFLLGQTEGPKHSTFDRGYKKMPAYEALKKDVLAAFKGKLKVSGSSGPTK